MSRIGREFTSAVQLRQSHHNNVRPESSLKLNTSTLFVAIAQLLIRMPMMTMLDSTIVPAMPTSRSLSVLK